MQTLAEAMKVMDRDCLFWSFEEKAEPALRIAREFNPKIARRIEQINAIIPVEDWGNLNGQPNPNNGSMSHMILFGRSYSRIMKVRIITTYPPFSSWTPKQFKELFDKLEALGKEWGADENWKDEETPSHIIWRYWWD